MSHTGSDFYKPFIFVLGALVLLTFFLLFVANSLSPDSPDDPLAIAEMKKSIAPVGRSRVVESAEPAEAAPVGTDASAASSAAQVSDAASVEANEESSEAAASTAADMQVAESGAENTESAAAETESVASTSMAATEPASMKVKAVVATNCAGCHNDGLHGAAKADDANAWSKLSEAGVDQLTASVINGKGKMPARAESSLSDAEIRQAVELMIANATGSDSTSAAGSAAVAATAATSTQTETAAEAAPSGEITAEVKKVVDSACAACHIAGVASAPKFGDKDAWAPRIEKGLDALVASAIAGIGVMPPRGGSTLDDEQMRQAVEYMLSK